MIRLGLREFEQLKQLAELAYPEEFCAILVGREENDETVVERVLPARNAHTNPRRAYAIPPASLIAAQRKARAEGNRIIGFVHSHPDHPPVPSATDLQEALWINHVYGIVTVSTGQFSGLEFYRLQGSSLDDRQFQRSEFWIA